MILYLNICLVIFLLHVAYWARQLIWPNTKSLYSESKSGFWIQAIVFSIPILNIIMFLLVLYFYAVLPAKMWNDE